MLTCKVGNTLINLVKENYDKYTLKKWDEEKRLLCPTCGKLYEYCHGEVVSPYFRHKEKSKECDEIYSESETEEHILGKTLLYKWLIGLQEQGVVSDVKLEAYIPETRQRPDLYFEKDEQRCVIEFQCSPIATEYLERHRLYELADVKDIWILGLDKYNLIVEDSLISHKNRYKVLEQHTSFYLNVHNNSFILSNDTIKKYLPYKANWLSSYYIFNIDNITFRDNTLSLTDNELACFIEQDRQKHEENVLNTIKKEKERSIVNNINNKLNSKFNNFKNGVYFYELDVGNHGYYLYKISFNKKHKDTHFGYYNIYTFYIKANKTDCSEEYEYSKPFIGRRGGIGWKTCTGHGTVNSIEYTKINEQDILSFILKQSSDYIRNTIYN